MSVSANFDQLDNFNLMDFFDPEKMSISNLGHYIESKKFQRGEFLYHPEDKAEYLFLVKKGRVKISVFSAEGKKIIKSILQADEIFGELALVGELNRREFVQAMEAIEVYVIPLHVAKTLMQQHQNFSHQITQLIGKNLLRIQRRLESLVFKDARSRIIQFLTDLANEKGRRVGYETLVPKFFTHQEIANLTDTSRQTVTTILNELRGNNLIYFDRKRLLVRNLEQLSEMIA